MKHIFVDERTEHINGLVSFFCLMLTQIALVGVIVYKRYFLGLPQEAYAEISWIAGLSMGGYWAIRLYLSGILPVISFREDAGHLHRTGSGHFHPDLFHPRLARSRALV